MEHKELTAKDAKAILDENIEAPFIEILDMIKEAATKGKSNIYLKRYNTDKYEDRLKTLGYTIEYEKNDSYSVNGVFIKWGQ